MEDTAWERLAEERDMSGLGNQIDGTHYTAMKMQPIELAYKLYATPCFCKLAKYLTRDKGDKLTNLKKARHCIELEKDLRQYAFRYMDGLDYLSTMDAKKIIDVFTDNTQYREALIWMWLGNWEGVIQMVDEIIQQYEERV